MTGLERGLSALGHSVYTCSPHGGYDLICVFNQVAHRPDYQYPELPRDFATTPLCFIDASEYGYFKRLPGIVRCFANAFSPGSVKHDTKNEGQQIKLRSLMEGRSFPYLIREMSKFVQWPPDYHPIDYPLYLHSEDHTPPNRDEYLIRDKDFFLSWGASHPWRWGITNALREAGQEVLVIEENNTPRMPQVEYFGRMRGAKTSASFDGYGSGSFRMTEILCRSLLLQGPLSISMRAPLVDGETCIMYQVESEGEEFRSTNIAQKLQEALSDTERSFEIYQRAFHHVHENLSEKATADHLIACVNAHDYSQPTQLEI